MKPFFFGRASRPLFGVYQPPRASARAASPGAERAVLLAYPGAQEYNNAHWAFRKLTGLLARQGFHVLRFDWSSTGDSSGDAKDGRPAAWVEDISAAAKELRDLSGAPSIDVVAMRLGAAIAALASIEGDAAVRAQRLVLWEPVVRGTTYVKDLEDLNARESFQLLHRTPSRDELVGFPFPDELRRAILEIALDRTPPVASREVAIFVGKEHDDHTALHRALEAGGRKVSFHVVPEDASVTNAGAREAALLANRVLTAMTEHLAS